MTPSKTPHQRVAHLYRQIKPFVFMLLILFSVRSSLADWNDVPTGSMNPTILEGDRIFVNKLAYDLKVPFTTWHLFTWGDPKRGDVVVFYSPVDGTRMVKRVIGLPGDVVQLMDNQLYVNGQPAQYGPIDPTVTADLSDSLRAKSVVQSESFDGKSHPVMEWPAASPTHRSFAPYTVPADKFFLMGDNRDNSFDSRFWGPADRNQIVGRATGVVLSLDPEHWLSPRWGRFFKGMP